MKLEKLLRNYSKGNKTLSLPVIRGATDTILRHSSPLLSLPDDITVRLPLLLINQHCIEI